MPLPNGQPRDAQPRDAQPRDAQPRDAQPRDAQSRESEPKQEPAEEFEIVMGRGQIAGVAFVVTVALAIFSSVAYLAGKSMSPKKAEPSMVVGDSRPAAPAPPAPPAVQPVPLIEATIAPALLPKRPASKAAPAEDVSEAPMFDEPAIGSVYLQMAAVERPNAAIFVDGLRAHGFRSFVAPGPDARIFRVLIGPLPTPASFEQAKQELDRIGLVTFARKYEK
jgi:cell division septation protein DedD